MLWPAVFLKRVNDGSEEGTETALFGFPTRLGCEPDVASRDMLFSSER